MWPYLIARVTSIACFHFTGKLMPRKKIKDLQKNLAEVNPHRRR